MRDPEARADEGAFVLEGPRVVAAALDRGARPEGVYLAPGADRAFGPLLERLHRLDVPVRDLKEGVLERVSAVVTPQPVLAVAARVTRPVDEFARDGLVLVAVALQDPGNAGTLIRSAEAFEAAGVVFGGNSVDVHNPKVVRSSAGAIFGVPIAEDHDPVEVLAAFGARGRRRLAAVPDGGDAPDALDLAAPVAVVLGNEARGLPPELSNGVDGSVTIPVAGAAESLNVAMAATVLGFEASRQRRERAR